MGQTIKAAVACGAVGLIGWELLCQIDEYLEINSGVASGNFMPLALSCPLYFCGLYRFSMAGSPNYILPSIPILLLFQLPQALRYPAIHNRLRSVGALDTICSLFGVSGLIVMNAPAAILDMFGPDAGAFCRAEWCSTTPFPWKGITNSTGFLKGGPEWGPGCE